MKMEEEEQELDKHGQGHCRIIEASRKRPFVMYKNVHQTTQGEKEEHCHVLGISDLNELAGRVEGCPVFAQNANRAEDELENAFHGQGGRWKGGHTYWLVVKLTVLLVPCPKTAEQVVCPAKAKGEEK